MRRAINCLLALALLAPLAPSTADAATGSQTPRTLAPSPDQGLIRLERPQGDEDVLLQLELETGKSVFIETAYRAKRVSVGNPDILDIVALGSNELQLVAKEVGTTNLLIWDTSGRPQAAIDIHVGAPHSRLGSELRRILGSDDIQVESAGNGVVLKGSVPTAIHMEQALSVARAVISEDGKEAKKIVNLLQVRGHQQVMLEVVIAEMSKVVRREFGTNFNALFESGGKTFQIAGLLQGLTSPQADGTIGISEAINLAGSMTGFGALESLDVFLDVLDEKGLSKILAEPQLVARSGETANFLVGGEVPIPVAQGGAFGSITVEYKQFGVGVGFTPTVLGPDRIHLEVRPEVSEIDFSFGTEVEGLVIPGFNTRRAATAVELGDGESFAIAGLLRDDLVELSGQYPILGQIPVLGALFRSSQYQKRATELVIIVTPRLVKPMTGGDFALPTDHFIEPSALEFYLLGRLEGRGDPDEDEGTTEQAATTTEDDNEAAGLIGGAGYQVSTLPEEMNW
ncbi:MAG: type II and III secretion system protein family protein [Deltaproteobacteria bacterium]|jgi:pilus assembly protein CpaC|nr:type II and III secretion system protein family protein [Deltaproteobacteria bacterium]